MARKLHASTRTPIKAAGVVGPLYETYNKRTTPSGLGAADHETDDVNFLGYALPANTPATEKQW